MNGLECAAEYDAYEVLKKLAAALYSKKRKIDTLKKEIITLRILKIWKSVA